MIQVLPPVRSFGQDFARSIGQGAGEGYSSAMADREKKSKLQQENLAIFKETGIDLTGVEDEKMRRDVFISELEGQRKQNESESKINQFKELFGSKSSTKPGAHSSFSDQIQNGDFSNITDQQLAQMALVDPARANSLRQIVHSQRQQKSDQNKISLDTLSSTKFGEGYQAILNDDSEALSEIISDPKTPYQIKNHLTGLKNQHDTRRDVRNREIRTRQNFIQTAYNKAITSERDLLKDAGKDESAEINKRIKKLANLKQKDMKKFIKDPESYSQLAIWDNEASGFLPDSELEEGEMQGAEAGAMEGLEGLMGAEGQASNDEQSMEPMKQNAKQGKIQLKNDDEAKVIIRQLLQETKGDKEAAMQLFAERYDL
jgi:hypothetical protein